MSYMLWVAVSSCRRPCAYPVLHIYICKMYLICPLALRGPSVTVCASWWICRACFPCNRRRLATMQLVLQSSPSATMSLRMLYPPSRTFFSDMTPMPSKMHTEFSDSCTVIGSRSRESSSLIHFGCLCLPRSLSDRRLKNK